MFLMTLAGAHPPGCTSAVYISLQLRSERLRELRSPLKGESKWIIDCKITTRTLNRTLPENIWDILLLEK